MIFVSHVKFLLTVIFNSYTAICETCKGRINKMIENIKNPFEEADDDRERLYELERRVDELNQRVNLLIQIETLLLDERNKQNDKKNTTKGS